MSIEYAILGLLSWRPMTGYDIKKMFAGSAAFYWSGNNNQIYTTLVRLHENGLVTREVEIQEDSPSRKIYSITPKGQAELKNWLFSEPEPPELKNAFLIQLAWADQLSPEELDMLLEKYEAEIQMQVSMLQTQKQQKNIAPSGMVRDAYINASLARTPREAVLWGMIQENWISFYENELKWVRKLRKQLVNP
ncbi:MAG TPA: helix-turn-helix transcriptional regulator [Anaerolineales bacterium]|nr:helix-turn-helix transcriptional regulator [Anaerolineales bacterium]